AIVAGRAKYGLDTRVPNMLFAAVARCPVKGGKLLRFDGRKAKAVGGVVDVVKVESGIAVLARDSWSALSGRGAVEGGWHEGPNRALTTEELWRRLDESAPAAGHVSRQEGDAASALAGAATRLSATYRDSFAAHGSVEPQNTTARVDSAGCEIWAPTQNPQRVQKEAAALLGIPPQK